ncbi:hypothetical protein LCGC14_3100550 [marine sediment metagenome]|uniref:Uncharacterized protein n=1 Tax=marine sediment metagenome TaxID=412755 RepID=A0A0F8W8E2_9ZZZZ
MKKKEERLELKSKMTVNEMRACDKYIQNIVREISPTLNTACKNAVKLVKDYTKANKGKKLETLLFIHREMLKYFVLYPVSHILIGDKSKEKLLGKEAAFTYNMTIAKDIVDTAMVESGAAEKIAEAIFKASGEMKPNKKDMSYIG